MVQRNVPETQNGRRAIGSTAGRKSFREESAAKRAEMDGIAENVRPVNARATRQDIDAHPAALRFTPALQPNGRIEADVRDFLRKTRQY